MDDSSGTHMVSSASELDHLLRTRNAEGETELWLAHDGQRNPALALLVKDEISVLHYFPGDGHPGFMSNGNNDMLDKCGTTSFRINGDDTDLPNIAVVPFLTALIVAKDFFTSPELPNSINWREL